MTDTEANEIRAEIHRTQQLVAHYRDERRLDQMVVETSEKLDKAQVAYNAAVIERQRATEKAQQFEHQVASLQARLKTGQLDPVREKLEKTLSAAMDLIGKLPQTADAREARRKLAVELGLIEED